jgi:hypothetical protein
MDCVMTKERELLRRALETPNTEWFEAEWSALKNEIRAFFAAEQEAEPVAYINLDEKRLEWAIPFEFKSSCFVLGKLPLYLHPSSPAKPARKPWQSLTDEDRLRLKNYWKQPGVGVDELADAIERTLKNKNHEIGNAYL